MIHYHLALCLVFRKCTEMVVIVTPQKGLMTLHHPKEGSLIHGMFWLKGFQHLCFPAASSSLFWVSLPWNAWGFHSLPGSPLGPKEKKVQHLPNIFWLSPILRLPPMRILSFKYQGLCSALYLDLGGQLNKSLTMQGRNLMSGALDERMGGP